MRTARTVTTRSDHRCCNPRRDFDLSLRVEQLDAVTHTAAYSTGVRRVIVPGKPASSAFYKLARGDLSFFQSRMPPLATERLDPALLPQLKR
ncbi:MAG: hypothetical protein ABW321_19260 [Polyangiales bacterium]